MITIIAYNAIHGLSLAPCLQAPLLSFLLFQTEMFRPYLLFPKYTMKFLLERSLLFSLLLLYVIASA